MLESLVIGSIAAGELYLAAKLPWWIGWFFAWCGVSTAVAALAYLLQRPSLLLKHRAAQVVLWPYVAFARAVAAAAQRGGLLERQEVVPGLWVGAWPRRGAPGFAQLDLTAEMPRRGEAARYRCIPMLDGAAPRPEAYREAVTQAVAWRREGLDVLVHCAYGHGRSVAVVVGVLLAEGIADDLPSAQAMVQRVRPRARMSPAQRSFLSRNLAQLRG
ncbi:MAG: hypothetical protein AAB215_02405 [Planctomycetota bacterium]